MMVSFFPYVVALIITGLLALGIMVVALKRSTVAGARSMAVLMGALAIWSIAYAFEIGSSSLALKHFWVKAQYFGIVILPVAWLSFALQYTGLGKWVNRRSLLLLLIEPAIMLALVLTNDLHGWVWGDVSLKDTLSGEILIITRSFFFYINIFYAYLLTLTGTALIVRTFVQSPPLFRRQMLVILIAALIPFVANILYITGVRPLNYLDLTPFGFAIVGVTATWGLLRYKLLNVIPIARHTLLDVMDEGVIVVDAYERIVDINRSGLVMVGPDAGYVIGHYAGDAIPAWDLLKSSAGKAWMSDSFTIEITPSDSGWRAHYQVHARPIADANDQVAGCMFLWSDITERKRMEDAVRHSEDIYRQSLLRSPNPIFSIDRQGNIQQWNPACETEFQYDQNILGQDWRILIEMSEEKRRVEEMLVNVFDDQASINAVELPFRTRSGRLLYMSSRIYPVTDADGSVVRCIFANTDITKRKQTENKLRRQLEELRVLHAVASACVESSDEDQIIERITEIIGNSIYPVNFGVMLVDEGKGVLRFHPSYRGIPPKILHTSVVPIGEGITGRVVLSGQPRRVDDVNAEPAYLNIYQSTRAEVCVPIKVGGKVIGVINAEDSKPGAFSHTDERLLMTLASQIAIAIDNARLFTETRHRAAQMEALNKIIAAGTDVTDVGSLLEQALEVIRGIMRVDMAVLWVNGYSISYGWPVDQKALSDFLRKNAAIFDGTHVISDWEQLAEDHRLKVHAPAITGLGVRASMFVPLLLEGARTGGLSLASTTPRVWAEEDVVLMQAVGQQLGSAAERLNLMAKIQAQAVQMKQIMDTVPEGVLLLDAGYRILLTNPAARKYLERLSGDGKYMPTLNELADRPISDILDYPGSWLEIEIGEKEKSVFAVAAQSLRSEDGPAGWVLVLRDQTQERETQQRIQIQERLATVGQLAAGIAHDFNNIMAAIVVYTELMMLEPGLSPAAHERLTIIQQQIQRATSLIRQILDFSRRSVMEHIQLDLLPFMKELDKLLTRVLPETIRLQLRYQPGAYLVNADPARLQQVFMNLALNARDAMPSGGELTFELDRIRVSDAAHAPMPEMARGDWICIRVRDTGSGIPKHIQEHIFEPFFTTKSVGQGTGLGLAQVYGIIKQHGGNIDVFSRLGAGAQFSIYLPLLEPVEDTQSGEKKQTGALSGAGERLLIVEDDWAARNALSDILKTQGYQMLEARNGSHALEVLKKCGWQVSLIVSDVVMPEMGGIALCQAVREKRPDIRFLLMTGHPLDEQSQLMLEEGSVMWMQKPFSGKEFGKVVRQLLDAE